MLGLLRSLFYSFFVGDVTIDRETMSLNRLRSEKHSLQLAYDEKNQQYNLAVMRNQDLDRKLQEVNFQLEQAKSLPNFGRGEETAYLKQKIRSLESSKEEIASDLRLERNELKKANEKLTNLQKQSGSISELQSQYKSLLSSYNERTQQHNLAVAQSQDLTRQLNDANYQLGQAKSLPNSGIRTREEIDQFRQQINILERSKNELASTLHLREKELEKSKQELTTLQKQLDATKDIESRYNQLYTAYNAKSKECSTYLIQKQDLEIRLRAVNSQPEQSVVKAKEEATVLKQKIKSLEKSKVDLESKIKLQDLDLAESGKKLTQYEQDIAKLKTESASFEDKWKKLLNKAEIKRNANVPYAEVVEAPKPPKNKM